MSQAKVDLNKEKKLNRKKEVKRRKVKHVLGILCTCLVCAVIIGWISFSVYQKQQDKALANPDTVTLDSTAINDYLNGISGDSSEVENTDSTNETDSNTEAEISTDSESE